MYSFEDITLGNHRLKSIIFPNSLDSHYVCISDPVIFNLDTLSTNYRLKIDITSNKLIPFLQIYPDRCLQYASLVHLIRSVIFVYALYSPLLQSITVLPT